MKTTLWHRELGAQHFNENEDIATTDFVPDPAADMKTTPYSKLKEGLIGVMEWRIHGNAVDIVAFNNINLDSGSFTIRILFTWSGRSPCPMKFYFHVIVNWQQHRSERRQGIVVM